MTDIERFRNFFDEMNIGFSEKEYNLANRPSVIVLSINDKHFDPHQYSASLDLRFDKETGKLIFIEPYGE